MTTMERISDLKFVRMRSRSPAHTRKPISHAFQHTETQFASTTTILEEDISSIYTPHKPFSRAASASSTSLHDLYHRHRRRSSSQKPRPRLSDPSIVEEDFKPFITRQQGPQYIYRHGRRYFQTDYYFLPSDLQETQRQNLGTLLSTKVLGGPFCFHLDLKNPPKKVLEIGCGWGYWSSLCHEYFVKKGIPAPSFTGMDMVNLHPDLSHFGLDWTFVQHDMTSGRFPFPDLSFDAIMYKDMATSTPHHVWPQLLQEMLRILRPGGFLECRETEYTFRQIVPSNDQGDEAFFARAGFYRVSTEETKFTSCTNKYVEQVSKWTEEAMSARDLCPGPIEACARRDWPEFASSHSRRVAIPLCAIMPDEPVTEERKAIRETALEYFLGRIEALDPIVKEVCGKTEEEWKRWWNSMVTNIIDENGCSAGECLETGAWWGRKPSVLG